MLLYICTGLSALKLVFSPTQRPSMLAISDWAITKFAAVTWSGFSWKWIHRELGVIRFWHHAWERVLVECPVFGVCLSGFSSLIFLDNVKRGYFYCYYDFFFSFLLCNLLLFYITWENDGSLGRIMNASDPSVSLSNERIWLRLFDMTK